MVLLPGPAPVHPAGGGANANLIEAAKKGYPPLNRAFPAKGTQIDAVDANGAAPLIRAGTVGIWSSYRSRPNRSASGGRKRGNAVGRSTKKSPGDLPGLLKRSH